MHVRIYVATHLQGFKSPLWLCDRCAPLEKEWDPGAPGRAIRGPCRRCRTVGDVEDPYVPPQKVKPAPPKQTPAARPSSARPGRAPLHYASGPDARTARLNQLFKQGLPLAAALAQVDAELKGA